MLTPSEIQSIEHGLFDIQQVGQDITVPFRANKLQHASVVWINERWFLERRIDVTDTDVRRRLDQWLIDEHAYLVPLDDDAPCDAAAGTKTFLADSYGNSEMATHGGSGRVGITGRFQVKGLGRTPLVGAAVDWLHSHGCLWLEEALREAVYAEITANEFPHGAVPVLAVIDTGLRHQLENGEGGERRALSIRPVVVRPAYFERAVLFQPPGKEHEARQRDVRRVRQVVQYFEHQYRQAEELALLEKFSRTFTSLARQIAFSRAQRLFPGNYASSNVSMEGELLDFGAFRALPNWCRAICMNAFEGFGNEGPELGGSMKSISFYVNKYKAGDSANLNPAALLLAFTEELERACAREFLYLFHLEEVEDEGIRRKALATLFAYYGMQQRFEVRYQNGVKKKLDWLGEVVAPGAAQADSLATERMVLADLAGAVRSGALDEESKELLCRRMRVTAARLLPVRQEIVRESLAGALNAVIMKRDAGDGSRSGMIEDAVNGIIARSRRHWPALPRNLIVLAQFSSPRCALCYCLDPENGKYFLWMEAASLNHDLWCLDQWLAQSVVEPYRYHGGRSGWYGLFPASASAPTTTAPELDLHLPDGAIWFDANESCGPK
ncbi:hypothetical protein [Massilia pseudoviolaceinigra]|uniref:hypothetical protein n=1 Tax=Massilia pseudoviolaceinigra TaxID=3057165 RepID=UPI002796CCFF|nr:hypothetical protein [Massilia sp. CCM 9206]MDQ1920918.1 hypothetical protein [Massilia sp. CCM 9206]